MNELNKLYSVMLKSWGVKIHEDGRLGVVYNGEETPIKVEGIPLYLPLSEILDGNTMDKTFFHPACENMLSKETEVFKIIRKLTGLALLSKFRECPRVLFDVANAKMKKSWQQNTLDMLEGFKGVRQPLREEFNKVLGYMNVVLEDDGVDNRFIHLKVTKGGGNSKITGGKVYYKAKPSFPFYNECVKKLARTEGSADNQLVDVNNFSVSRRALKLLVNAFQAIIPAVMSPDDYEFEAYNPTAARLSAYLSCYAEIAEQMNRLQNLFRVEFDKQGIYPINVSWLEQLEELPDIARQVPVMDYNSHHTNDNGEVRTQNALGDLFSGNVTNTNQPAQNNAQNNSTGIRSTPQGDFDVTPPQMHPGDVYQSTDIDYVNGHVLHRAVNTATGNRVTYHCTRNGNYLNKVEEMNTQAMYQQQQPMMYNQYGQPMVQQPMMYNQYGQPQQQQQPFMGYNTRPMMTQQPVMSVVSGGGTSPQDMAF